jgi:hypothetical protein
MNKGQRLLMWSLLLAGGIFGCSRQPVAGPDTPNPAVVEKPQAKDASANPSSTAVDPKDARGNPPTVKPKAQDADREREHSFTLNPTGAGAAGGNVHLYHVTHLNRPAAWDDQPFFVVWTDAKGYSSAAGIDVSHGGPDKKASDPEERSFHVNLTLTYSGKDNEGDRETKCSFHLEVLDQKGQINDGQKGQLQIDGKTYDVGKGTLVLVAGRDGDVRVKLLPRSKLPRDLEEVIALGKADADIKAFFPDLVTLPYFSEAAKAE